MFAPPPAAFKLQAPPVKAPSATPKTQSPLTQAAPPLPFASSFEASPSENVQEHGPVAAHEPTYDAVPIPGAYAAGPASYGQAM